jgi:hypothetical protein
MGPREKTFRQGWKSSPVRAALLPAGTAALISRAAPRSPPNLPLRHCTRETESVESTVNTQVAGQSLLGHGRGRYTPAELRAIDAAAADWGLEVVACIQTLGHLEQVLQVRLRSPQSHA